jgi:hypothetical protein
MRQGGGMMHTHHAVSALCANRLHLRAQPAKPTVNRSQLSRCKSGSPAKCMPAPGDKLIDHKSELNFP